MYYNIQYLFNKIIIDVIIIILMDVSDNYENRRAKSKPKPSLDRSSIIYQKKDELLSDVLNRNRVDIFYFTL